MELANAKSDGANLRLGPGQVPTTALPNSAPLACIQGVYNGPLGRIVFEWIDWDCSRGTPANCGQTSGPPSIPDRLPGFRPRAYLVSPG